ncbi:hypothetical protein MASR2M39_05800 [Ignavibacteriales bacterium]
MFSPKIQSSFLRRDFEFSIPDAEVFAGNSPLITVGYLVSPILFGWLFRCLPFHKITVLKNLSWDSGQMF